MILLVALVVSVIVAALRGGQFSRLAQLPVRHGWLALAAMALQVVVIYYPRPSVETGWGGHTLLLGVAYALLVGVTLLNVRLPGLAFIGLGLALNLAVMLANGGYMPITLEALQRAGLAHLALGTEPGARVMATKDVLLPREMTRLWLLSDILVVPPPLPLRTVFSIGDVLLAVGAFVFFQRATQAGRPPNVTER